MIKDINLLSSHPNFNFDEARIVALYYSRSKQTLSINDLTRKFSYERKKINRCFKVAIILSLISDDDIENIINKRATSFYKNEESRMKSIKNFEKMLELNKERKEIIKKISFFNNVFKGQKEVGGLIEKYKNRLLEIENFIFK